MESIVPCRYVHTGQGQGPGPTVTYCTSPVPCTGPGPFPCRLNKPLLWYDISVSLRAYTTCVLGQMLHFKKSFQSLHDKHVHNN